MYKFVLPGLVECINLFYLTIGLCINLLLPGLVGV